MPRKTAPVQIDKLSFEDRRTGWTLSEASFDAFNLLVGVSGVGKTQILRAIQKVRALALGQPENDIGACSWSIAFRHDGRSYQWSGRVDGGAGGEEDESEQPTRSPIHFKQETVVVDEDRQLVSRNGDFFFEGSPVPRLKSSESALELLAEERSIRPIRAAFKSFLFSADSQESLIISRSSLEKLKRRMPTFEELRRNVDAHPILKAYLLQEACPEQWREVQSTFKSIFPSVDVIRTRELRSSDILIRGSSDAPVPFEIGGLSLSLKERGNDHWISEGVISSGMLRTFMHLVEIFLAPPGTVVMIDEFENSLGKNCMPQVTEFILGRAPDIQFILTSHHPYIINSIPIKTWKLVQRRGATVRMLPARDIPALQEASHHDAFDRLLNLREFDEGIG